MSRAISILLALPFCAGFLRADDSELSPADRAVQAQELRLQEQRAAALRSRLLLYTDELQKLRDRFQSQKNDSAVAAVDGEMEGVKSSIHQLRASALERLASDPPEEKDKEKEQSATRPAPSVVLARRVDAIIRRLGEAKRDATLASSNPGNVRMKVLKIEDARKNGSSGSYKDGRDYWTSQSAVATWTVSDVQPGTYEVEFRYACGKDGGNVTMSLKAAGQTLTFDVPEGTNMSKRMSGVAQGLLKITEPAFDLRISAPKMPEGKNYCWDLREVVLRPAGLARPKTP